MNEYLKEIADLCGIEKKLTSHIARHTFATTVTLLNGVSIESVPEMMGIPISAPPDSMQKCWMKSCQRYGTIKKNVCFSFFVILIFQ
ncbi:hypothetical protein OQX63_00235 [Pedobacter sp. PF22-3]|uniref:hypothetical protein n=1 Tax=Pedobacter sp. PF22-3 TaxID=2994467 RepID=UPI002245AC3F|nr:hypothetical protein [Pedobacter sp. PF22-3]MCX2491877.1 hypothetical protein [Pedobacter sp. PF22-3]